MAAGQPVSKVEGFTGCDPSTTNIGHERIWNVKAGTMKASTNGMIAQTAWTTGWRIGVRKGKSHGARERGEKVLSGAESILAPWLTERCEEKDDISKISTYSWR